MRKNKSTIIFTTILVSILFSHCATEKLINREEQFFTYSIDFRDYAEKGFLFTPNKYEGEHTVLGLITVELHPEIEYNEVPENIQIAFDKRGYSKHTFYHSGGNRMVKYTKSINVQELIKEVYSISMDWGGNGFSELDIERKTTGGSITTSYEYLTISGIVIKRE